MTTDGEAQHWNASAYAANAAYVPELGVPVVELLAPKRGERILDVGCGDGVLTERIKERGCEVVGVDASQEMVDAARSRELTGHVMDGQALTFENEFDAVFSNAALHWMKRPFDVIMGVWRSLKPGGRFVGELGAQGNVATIVNAIEQALVSRGVAPVNPWFFPSDLEYRGLLERAGFRVPYLEVFSRPTVLDGDVAGWLRTFAVSQLSQLPEADQDAFIPNLVEMLRPKLRDETGIWKADYVRLRFAATKPR